MKTKPKYLTRGQAWRKIGRAFQQFKHWQNYSRFTSSGLCYAVTLLHCDGWITKRTRYAMNRQLERYRRDHNKHWCDYWWPLDRNGARCRANVCKAFAGGLK